MVISYSIQMVVSYLIQIVVSYSIQIVVLYLIQMVLLYQGRHGEFEPGKDQYYRVGLICPPGWDRVKVSQNLGKDQSFPAFPAVATLIMPVTWKLYLYSSSQIQILCKSKLSSVVKIAVKIKDCYKVINSLQCCKQGQGRHGREGREGLVLP